MNILFFSEYYYPHIGGVEIALKNIGEGLVKKGHNVGVVTTQTNHTPLDNINGVSIYGVKQSHLRYFYFLNSLRKWKILKNYDIINTYNSVPMLSGYFFKKVFKKPCVLTVLEVLGKTIFKYSGIVEASLNYTSEFVYPKLGFDMFTPISNNTRDLLIKYGAPENKVKTIYLGVDHTKFRPSKVNQKLKEKLGIDGKVYAFAGRTSKLKGLSDLIRAANIVRSKCKKSKLLLFIKRADPHVDEYDIVMELIKRFGLQDHVKIIENTIQDNPEYMNLADVFVTPSITEGFGLTAAEASSMGKPVVATRAGSLPEIILDKQTGLLSNTRSPEQLAENILYLFDNSGEAKKMGMKGAKYTEKFDWKNTVREYVKIYKSILNRNCL